MPPRWAAAAAAATAVVSPLLLEAAGQTRQLAWIDPIGPETVREVLVTQHSPENVGFAVLVALLVVVGLAATARRREGRAIAAIAVPWALVPPAALIVVSIVGDPIYTPRYAALCTPAVALCMAVGAARIPRRVAPRALAAIVAVATLVSLPTWVQQRTVTAKEGTAWNEVAALIAHERTSARGDEVAVVVYGPVAGHPATTSRIIASTYPDAFEGLLDPLLVGSEEPDGLWPSQAPLADVGRETIDADTIWFVTSPSPDAQATVAAAVADAGFQLDGSWQRGTTLILRYRR